MPAPYGVTASGFNAKTLEEIKADLESALRAGISPNLNLASSSPVGQLVGVFADASRALWELGQAVYTVTSPDSATDAGLENVAALTGTVRKAATKSRVTCTVDLDVGIYPAGSLVAHPEGSPEDRFVSVASVTSGGGATSAVFEAEETGPVQALAGTLTVIAEPLNGFNSVTNPLDAELGSDAESDAALRVRLQREKSLPGTGTASAIRAAVSAIPGVQYARVVENATDETNAEGVPPRSFHVIVFDGAPPAVANNVIAQTIYDNKGLGVLTFGALSGIAEDGDEQSTQFFSRVQSLDLYLSFDLVTDANYPGDAAFKTAIAEWADANIEIGETVVKAQLIGAAMGVPGVVDVTSLLIDSVSPPVLSVNFPIGSAQIANISTGNITVT